VLRRTTAWQEGVNERPFDRVQTWRLHHHRSQQWSHQKARPPFARHGTRASSLVTRRLFKLKEIWANPRSSAARRRRRELGLFNLAIDSKLRACDLVKLRVRHVCHGQSVASRTIVRQQKTQRLGIAGIRAGSVGVNGRWPANTRPPTPVSRGAKADSPPQSGHSRLEHVLECAVLRHL
jgi:hypothetical protein